MFKHQTASILHFQVSPPGFLSQQDDSLKLFIFISLSCCLTFCFERTWRNWNLKDLFEKGKGTQMCSSSMNSKRPKDSEGQRSVLLLNFTSGKKANWTESPFFTWNSHSFYWHLYDFPFQVRSMLFVRCTTPEHRSFMVPKDNLRERKREKASASIGSFKEDTTLIIIMYIHYNLHPQPGYN